jgi:CheY-like chemotaxis protein
VRELSASTEIDATTADVLIVEDDADTREGLLDLVQQLGYVAVAAPDGVEGLLLARERSPRLILLDLQMPVMNGRQFLLRRREAGTLAAIPVVIVSAEGTELVERDDVQGWLGKPVDGQRLEDVLRAFCPSPRSAPATGPTVLVVEDDDDTRASISEALEEQGYRVACACNGEDAEAQLQAGTRPDCIVLDLMMPRMDGWTFADRLQRMEGPPIPTVVITAAGPHWGYPVPPARVMTKPLQVEMLLALVGQLTTASAASGYGRSA